MVDEILRKVDNYVACGLLILGTLGGSILGASTYRPSRLYEIDVDKDGKKDIITESDFGKRQVFLRQEDDSLLRFDYAQKNRANYIESALEKEIKSSASKKE